MCSGFYKGPLELKITKWIKKTRVKKNKLKHRNVMFKPCVVPFHWENGVERADGAQWEFETWKDWAQGWVIEKEQGEENGDGPGDKMDRKAVWLTAEIEIPESSLKRENAGGGDRTLTETHLTNDWRRKVLSLCLFPSSSPSINFLLQTEMLKSPFPLWLGPINNLICC